MNHTDALQAAAEVRIKAGEAIVVEVHPRDVERLVRAYLEARRKEDDASKDDGNISLTQFASRTLLADFGDTP